MTTTNISKHITLEEAFESIDKSGIDWHTCRDCGGQDRLFLDVLIALFGFEEANNLFKRKNRRFTYEAP